mgnify:CR=1 FL=1
MKGKLCCRYHIQQSACVSIPSCVVEESTFSEAEDERVAQYVRRHFPIDAYKAQGADEGVLEDFADALVREVFLKIRRRRWNCLVAEDGRFGLVGLDDQEEVLIALVRAGGLAFLLYVF